MPNAPPAASFPDGLCENCQAQNDFHYGNFDHLASEELPRSHAITIPIGTLEDILNRQSQCAFCTLVISAISTAWKQSPLLTRIDEKPVACRIRNRVVGVVRKPGSKTAYHENFRANEYQYTSCRLVIECKPAPPGCHSDVEIQAVDSGPELKGLFDNAPLFTKRPSQKLRSIDFDLVRKWLTYCSTSHPRCTPDPVNSTDPYLHVFRLIDVSTLNIVSAPPAAPYAALSYVWGKAPFLRLLSSNVAALSLPNALVPSTLPPTICHAILATQNLSLRYLWVDALCIMQDNLPEKSVAISAMDLIYARANLTIVAASGTHAGSGLPGIEPNSRDLAPYEITIGFPQSRYRFAPARSSPPDVIRQSAWNTRGWTYQERLCSHRLLVFSQQQIVYLCGEAAWCEDTVLETESELVHYEAQPLYRLNMPNDATNSFMKDVEAVEKGGTSLFGEYARMVDEYTSRDLTFPGDVLDAFEGGLKRFQERGKRSGTDVEFVFGLPTRWLELGLVWEFQMGGRRRFETWRGFSGKEMPFPSWSWMGWVGKTDAKVLEPPTRPEIEWYYVDPGEETPRRLMTEPVLDPNPGWFQTSDAPRVFRERWKPVGSPTAVSSSILRDFDPGELAGKLVFYTSSCFLTLTKKADFLSGKANTFSIGNNVGFVNLDPEWAGQHLGQTFEFIVLARYLTNDWEEPGMRDTLWVMLIERKGRVAYRVGVGNVNESSWVSADPTWQLVALG
ncbi:hypothetical protein OQA88_5628 [Cercophora sp. LCS_1]